jgi:molybdopterin-guanine dinucleotide biosynthesis protein A
MPTAIPPSSIVGVLLAGGRSQRMGGGDKCLLPFRGRTLLGHAIGRLRPQVGAMALNANGPADRFAAFGLPVAGDVAPGFPGPLAGILTGMIWAKANAPGARYVASVATDTPFFPRDLVTRLVAAIDRDHAMAMAASGGRRHPVFGLFPVALAADLAQFIGSSATLSVMAWAERHSPATACFAPQHGFDPFFNINTPEDLAAAGEAG